MKLWAIQQRATQKDYIDILSIIREIWLSRVLECFREKYGDIISESLLIKSIIYFDDVDRLEIKMIAWDSYDWKDIQNELIKEVKKYMKSIQ